MTKWTISVIHMLAVCVGLGAAASLTLGASAQTAPAVDPIPALLAEVHALRLAMERSAAIAPRVQLTMARLSIEEQRVAHLSSQLDVVRQQLSGFSSVTDGSLKERITEMEARAAAEVDPVKRATYETQARELKYALTTQAAMEQQLRIRENEINQALATEQLRWTDLNQRLDELDRSLGPMR